MKSTKHGFLDLLRRADYSFLRDLTCDPQQGDYEPNRTSRQVRSGHYVLVKPVPLPMPYYIAHSSNLAGSVFGINDDEARTSELFLQFFSGDVAGAAKTIDGLLIPSVAGEKQKKVMLVEGNKGWATPYALSVFGNEMYQNCPFKNGNGYGDGRAISILEVLITTLDPPSSATKQTTELRYEFQLKGGGPTPFCRGGDGRAVLRSSIREFLVSEALHHLRVHTTRALCLFASGTETATRMWYSPGSRDEEPDRVGQETVAISTRVAPSFLRVGHLELFARRCRKLNVTRLQLGDEPPQSSKELMELENIVRHAIIKEYPDEIKIETRSNQKDGQTRQDKTDTPPTSANSKTIALNTSVLEDDVILKFADLFGKRLARLICGWIRIGYCQGNFNGDNCALGGRTLDFGPFGFVEKFRADFQMWTGGGQHFSFLGQPTAAAMNYKMFCYSLVPLLKREKSVSDLTSLLRRFPAMLNHGVGSMFLRKLGFQQKEEGNEAPSSNEKGGGNENEDKQQQLVSALLQLMEVSEADYTILFRELCNLPLELDSLNPCLCFYHTLTTAQEERWSEWLAQWRKLRQSANSSLLGEEEDEAVVRGQMRRENPKYIPREWMLVHAYRAAIDARDYTILKELQVCFEDCYSEQTYEIQSKYYRRATSEDLVTGGTAHMT